MDNDEQSERQSSKRNSTLAIAITIFIAFEAIIWRDTSENIKEAKESYAAISASLAAVREISHLLNVRLSIIENSRFSRNDGERITGELSELRSTVKWNERRIDNIEKRGIGK